jgi:hypothetical protein
MKYVILLAMSGLLAIVLVGCAHSDPAATVQAYLQARVESNADKLRSLSCASWEQDAVKQADSFRSMNAVLDNVTCSVQSQDSSSATVKCDGNIVTTYNGEKRNWALGKYKVVQEGGDWKMCGETN